MPRTPGFRTRHRPVALLAAALLGLAACSDTTAGPTQLIQPEGDATTAGPPPTAAPDDDAGSTEPTDGGNQGEAAEPAAVTAPSATSAVWSEVDFNLVTVATLAQPISLKARPGEDDLWVLERAGRVRRISRELDESAGTETLSLMPEAVLDLTAQVTTEGEGGLLGMDFSPDGSSLYLHYTERSEGSNVISEFPLDAAGNPGPERIMLTVPEPFSNHNGGDLDVDADGLLYISLGDGGAGGDPLGSGQDATTLLGSILRIDPTPSADAPYTIPADNPFADATDGTRPEIWLWGLRNPWRMSLDTATGDLWLGDVGQELIEEVNVVAPTDGGANLGWNLVEGNRPYGGEAPENHLAPLYTYDHEQGRCSVTGGFVYRGSVMPALDGVYLFADFCAPGVAGVQRNGSGEPTVAELALDRRPEQVIGFGQGASGELYVLEAGGAVSRVQVPDWPWTVVTA